jgi:Tubulin-tyrosine ligase family
MMQLFFVTLDSPALFCCCCFLFAMTAVLQAEVVPALLVKGGRKFHIRSYVVVIERPFDEEVLDMYIFGRHEVRIAGVAVDPKDTNNRNRMAHITNGALCETTERTLLHLVPELVERNLQEKLEIFIAKVFAKHLFPDIHRRVQLSASQAEDAQLPTSSGSSGTPPPRAREFALAGIDLMVTDDDRIYLLEVNNNPSAPPKRMSDEVFTEHLTGFLRELINLVAGQRTPNFMDAFAILEQNGLLD